MPYIPKNEHPIYKLLGAYHINASELSKILGCSAPTARARIKDPDSFTVRDLGRIWRRGHVPIEEIRDAIGKA